MRRYGPLLAVLLVTAAGLSWWLGQSAPPAPVSTAPGAPDAAREVDYTITSFYVVRMTEVGKPADVQKPIVINVGN